MFMYTNSVAEKGLCSCKQDAESQVMVVNYISNGNVGYDIVNNNISMIIGYDNLEINNSNRNIARV